MNINMHSIVIVLMFDSHSHAGWNKYKPNSCSRSCRSGRTVNNKMVSIADYNDLAMTDLHLIIINHVSFTGICKGLRICWSYRMGTNTTKPIDRCNNKLGLFARA